MRCGGGQHDRGAPTDPGAAAAEERVAALLDHLSRIGLQVVVVEPPNAIRHAARDRARAAAIVAGRHRLFEDAAQAARDLVLQIFARSGFSGTWAFTDMAISVAGPGDRIASAAAFEEAAMAAVVEDLIDAETLDVLRATAGSLTRLTGLPTPGSLAGFASATGSVRRPLGIGIAAILIFMIVAIGIIAARWA